MAIKKMETKQLPITRGTRFEQIFHRDHRYCECEMPMTSKKWNDALGRFVVVRLCCMAKALEKLTGMNLYEVFDFEPKWVWDCDAVETPEDIEGVYSERKKGPPPKWLTKRLQDKGIEIRNLNEEDG